MTKEQDRKLRKKAIELITLLQKYNKKWVNETDDDDHSPYAVRTSATSRVIENLNDWLMIIEF